MGGKVLVVAIKLVLLTLIRVIKEEMTKMMMEEQKKK